MAEVARSGVSEAGLQKQIRDSLTVLGYTVMETGKGRSRVQCTRCGNRSYATGWQGNTPGLPDLYIHRDGWESVAVAVELKTDKGKPSDAQRWLASRGITTICRSLADVLRLLIIVERRWGNESHAVKLNSVLEVNGWT